MRFVGPFTFVTALMTVFPSSGWCQIASDSPTGPQATPVTAAESAESPLAGNRRVRPASGSSLAPPSAGGSWIDDSAPVAQEPLVPPVRPIGPPLPYSAYARPVANIYGDPSMGPPSMPGPGPGMQPAMLQTMDPQMQPQPEAEDQHADDGSGYCSCGREDCPNNSFEARFCRRFFGPVNTNMWDDVHAHHRVYGSIDTLVWWTRGNPVPALITTSTAGTPQAAAGVLGQPNTSVVYGNDQINTAARSGARLNIGYWLVDGEFWGIEGHYLSLGSGGSDFTRSDNFTTDPNASILARPFLNTQTGLQDSALVAFPNYNLNGTTVNLNGFVNVHSTTNLQSSGALLRHLLWIDFESQWRVDIVGGYRFFRADDSVQINDNFTTQGGLLAPTTFASTDLFGAYNVFNGGGIGLAGQYQMAPRLSMSTLTKIALGNVHERVGINGANSISTLGTTITTPGGLLTQPTNIGTYTRNQFGILPEVGLNLRYDLTCRWRLTMGYTFIYLNRTQRSGNAINTTLNPTQINGGTLVGTAAPTFHFASSDYWAQGLNFGAEFRW